MASAPGVNFLDCANLIDKDTILQSDPPLCQLAFSDTIRLNITPLCYT